LTRPAWYADITSIGNGDTDHDRTAIPSILPEAQCRSRSAGSSLMRNGKRVRVGLLICTVSLIGLLTAGTAAAYSATGTTPSGPPFVELLGWQGRGEIPSNGLFAPAHFKLTAAVRWQPDAPRDPGRYRVEVIPADGSASVSFPLSANEAPNPKTERMTVWVPANAVRNRPVSQVQVRVRVIDSRTGEPVSRNVLTAALDQFPRPGATAEGVPEQFGWGSPLRPKSGGAQKLARRPDDGEFGADLNEGPQGYMFIRVFGASKHTGYFVATAESRLDQVRPMLKGYEPNLRAGEFVFFADSPAIGLSPTQAEEYLGAIGSAEGLGLTYRLPTREEWLQFARASRSTRFWWGDDPDDDAARLGANFKGAERPGSAGSKREDEVDIIRQTPNGGASLSGFQPNPWSLWHTFGNVSEWAIDSAGDGYWMMGGNFRTERDKANFRPDDLEIPLKKDEVFKVDANAFVGVRPVVEISPEQGKAALEATLKKSSSGSADFRAVNAAYDPDTATATLTGEVADVATRLRADAALQPIWFLASVSNRLSVRQAAVLGDHVAALDSRAASESVRCTLVPAGKVFLVPVGIRWASRLPVEGSEYWINVFRRDTGARISGTQLHTARVGRTSQIEVPIESSQMASHGLPITSPVVIALSLGKEPAQATNDSRVVSNIAELKWTLRPENDCPEPRGRSRRSSR
jgi:hypothetical protein